MTIHAMNSAISHGFLRRELGAYAVPRAEVVEYSGSWTALLRGASMYLGSRVDGFGTSGREAVR